jgi:RNase P/RNase MRP subunit p29
MSAERIESLLEEFLATGTVPAGATDAEQAELFALQDAALALRASLASVERQAGAAMPAARARFERYIRAAESEARPPAREAIHPPESRRGRSWGGVLAMHRGLTAFGTAALLGSLALVALFVSQALLSDVESASAQVLTPGDYVQVSGVVASATGEGDAQRVTLSSELGDLNVAVSQSTSVVDDQTAQEHGSLHPGDPVLVGGLVGKDRSIVASTLAVTSRRLAPGERVGAKQLHRLEQALDGKVVTLTISSDGKSGQLVLDDGKGNRFLVRISGTAAETLLSNSATALGTRILATLAGEPSGVFSVQIVPESTATPAVGGSPTVGPPSGPFPAGIRPDAGQAPQRPSFVGIRGTIVGREGNVITVETAKGTLQVVLRADTRLLLLESGLARDAVLHGDSPAIGHRVTISGGYDPQTNRVLADVVVLGPRVTR